jgi:pimeloyl-ACP methyl ester carboxylesterase
MDINHRIVETNGIKMHIAEKGEGPLVLMCHGFPEFWYSWRHQLPALADVGYHAVAPDQRGYGQTDRPESIDAYNIFELVADLVGLVNALGEDQAVIVGHDWGAPVAWHCALLRPDIFKGLILLSVPYFARSWDNIRPTEMMKIMQGDGHFYQLYFQETGKVEKELEENVRETMLKSLYTASANPPPNRRWHFLFRKEQRFIDSLYMPDTLPDWLTEEDVNIFTKSFEQTGFRGAVNWYRNIDRNWERSSFLSEAKILQPTLFIAGENDATVDMNRSAFDNMEKSVLQLKKKIMMPGTGHWIQQERPREINDLIIDFLKSM